MSLELIVKRPGNRLASLLGLHIVRTSITEQQYAEITLLLARPDEFRVTRRPSIGFRTPEERKPNVGS